jgi:hypothetical protein
MWFSEMKCRELLFYLEDDPLDIIQVTDGVRVFSDAEVDELRFLVDEMVAGLGHEKMIEAAYPVFMTTCETRLDA